MTAFVVEADRPGFSVGKLEHKLGIRGSPTGQPIFDDVRVPAENVIGEVGSGLARRARHARADAARRRRAGASGSPRARPTTRSPTPRERSQFGKPINEFQAIQFKLADMETRTAAARELLYKACAMADRDDPDARQVLLDGEAVLPPTPRWRVTVEAVQVLGGYGYVKEYPVERMMRDAKITQIYEGTNEIQRARDRPHAHRGSDATIEAPAVRPPRGSPPAATDRALGARPRDARVVAVVSLSEGFSARIARCGRCRPRRDRSPAWLMGAARSSQCAWPAGGTPSRRASSKRSCVDSEELAARGRCSSTSRRGTGGRVHGDSSPTSTSEDFEELGARRARRPARTCCATRSTTSPW